MDVVNTIKAAMAVIGGGVGFFLGGMDGFLLTLILFVAADYVTGVMAAIVEKKLNSEVGLTGIFRKVMIFVLVGVANMLDSYIFNNVSPIRDAVIFFYLANEGISILENASRLGVPFPDKLKDVLEQVRDNKAKKK